MLDYLPVTYIVIKNVLKVILSNENIYLTYQQACHSPNDRKEDNTEQITKLNLILRDYPILF